MIFGIFLVLFKFDDLFRFLIVNVGGWFIFLSVVYLINFFIQNVMTNKNKSDDWSSPLPILLLIFSFSTAYCCHGMLVSHRSNGNIFHHFSKVSASCLWLMESSLVCRWVKATPCGCALRSLDPSPACGCLCSIKNKSLNLLQKEHHEKLNQCKIHRYVCILCHVCCGLGR